MTKRDHIRGRRQGLTDCSIMLGGSLVQIWDLFSLSHWFLANGRNLRNYTGKCMCVYVCDT